MLPFPLSVCLLAEFVAARFFNASLFALVSCEIRLVHIRLCASVALPCAFSSAQRLAISLCLFFSLYFFVCLSGELLLFHLWQPVISLDIVCYLSSLLNFSFQLTIVKRKKEGEGLSLNQAILTKGARVKP